MEKLCKMMRHGERRIESRKRNIYQEKIENQRISFNCIIIKPCIPITLLKQWRLAETNVSVVFIRTIYKPSCKDKRMQIICEQKVESFERVRRQDQTRRW